MKRAMSVTVLAVTLLTPLSARAQPGTQETPALDSVVVDYSGWILASSAASVAMFVAGAVSEGPNGEDSSASNSLFTAGIVTAMLGGPVIHLAHGNVRGAGGSLLMRWLLPGVGAGIGLAISESRCGPAEDLGDISCGLEGLGQGFLGGVIVASVIDYAFLAEVEVSRPRQTEAAVVMPLLSQSKKAGTTVGIAAAIEW